MTGNTPWTGSSSGIREMSNEFVTVGHRTRGINQQPLNVPSLGDVQQPGEPREERAEGEEHLNPNSHVLVHILPRIPTFHLFQAPLEIYIWAFSTHSSTSNGAGAACLQFQLNPRCDRHKFPFPNSNILLSPNGCSPRRVILSRGHSEAHIPLALLPVFYRVMKCKSRVGAG